MIEKAIKKINNEIAEIKEPYGERLGTYLITDLLDSEKNAEKILNEKKTLKGCYSAIKEKAHGLAVSGMAMVDDETVFGWLRDYYGIKKASAEKPEKEPESGGPVLHIEDFL